MSASNFSMSFVSLGFNSLDLLQLRDRISNILQVDLSKTALFDFPSLEGLISMIDTRGAMRSDRTILAAVMQEFGYPCVPEKNFTTFVMCSIYMVQIRDRLMVALQVPLPSTLLLDYPSLRKLEGFLGSLRTHTVRKLNLIEDLFPVPLQWEFVSKTKFIAILMDIEVTLKLSKVQQGLNKLAMRCYPNKSVYIDLLEQILIAVEGPVFFHHGLISETTHSTVLEAQKMFNSLRKKFAPRSRVVRSLEVRYQNLTKLDQVGKIVFRAYNWNGQSCPSASNWVESSLIHLPLFRYAFSKDVFPLWRVVST